MSATTVSPPTAADMFARCESYSLREAARRIAYKSSGYEETLQKLIQDAGNKLHVSAPVSKNSLASGTAIERYLDSESGFEPRCDVLKQWRSPLPS